MSFWRALKHLLVSVVAIVAMGFAATVTYTPELLPPNIRLRLQTVTERVDSQTFLILLGVMVALGGVIGLWLWRTRGLGTTFFDKDIEESNRDVPVAGSELKDSSGWETKEHADLSPKSVRESLRDVLFEVYREDFDGQADVETYLNRGEWTTDRYAAAFISTSQAIDYPVHHRIIAWLYPNRAREIRVKRALRAVESVADGRFSLYEKTTHQPTGMGRLKAILKESRVGEKE